VGEFILAECIGADGVDPIYRAVHPVIRKEVAIQILRHRLADSPEELQRRLAEARTVNALHHRGILDLFSFGTLPDGQQYLMMELLRGHTLKQELERRGCLPAGEVLGLLDEVLAALEAAHGVGVAHHELTPANIFLAEQSDGTRYVKLLRFGMRGAHVRPVSPMANLYALGGMAFQLLTGELPAPGAAPSREVLRRHQVPAAFEELLLQLVCPRPEALPESARDVRQQLAQLREKRSPEAAASSSETPAVPLAPPAPSRHSMKRTLAFGVLIGALVALGAGPLSCEERAQVSSLLDIQLP
jgi:serine/threonine-protein kinase